MTSPKPRSYTELTDAALRALDAALTESRPGTPATARIVATTPMVLAQLATAAAVNDLTEQLRAQAHNPTVVLR